MAKKIKVQPPAPVKQNSDVFNSLAGSVVNVNNIVMRMDKKKDTSHGLFFSSALSEEQKNVKTNLVVWGNPQDISSMIYTACKKSPELSQLISNVAINIAVDRIKKTSAKTFTGNEAALMTGNDRSLIVPEES